MSTLEGVQVGRDRDAAGQGQPRLPACVKDSDFDSPSLTGIIQPSKVKGSVEPTPMYMEG